MWEKCPPEFSFVPVDHDDITIGQIIKIALNQNPKYELYDDQERKFDLSRLFRIGDDRFYRVFLKRKGPWGDATIKAAEILGCPGRMVCGSTSLYRELHPANITIFNSNVCIAEGKIWYGDIDITVDTPKLLELAKALGQTVYVLYEMDGRFENEDHPLIEKAIFKVVPTGEVVPGDRLAECVQLCRRGTLAGRWVYKKEYRR